MEIFKEFKIEAAHRLPLVPKGHKCERLHGHSFRIEVWLEGEVDPEAGWVMDYFELDQAFAPLFDRLDHHFLNEIDGLSNPTSENLARWLWERLCEPLPGLSRIVIRETCDTGCVYRGPA
jgi:6-pyruvoyltetrahydropterin/6-carboxytetrahydropterin synthase